jgi:hypothetical protein
MNDSSLATSKPYHRGGVAPGLIRWGVPTLRWSCTPLVRALALHLRSRELRVGEALDLLRRAEAGLGSAGLRVWTRRVSFGEYVDWREVEEFCGVEEVLVAPFHRRVDELRVGELVEFLRRCPNGYATILVPGGEYLDLLPRIYLEVSKELVEDFFTRLGVAYGSYVHTPYFPVSTALRNSLSLAYRYVDLLVATDPADWYGRVVELAGRASAALEEVARSAGLEVLHDLSLSPWMEESAVDVVEKLGARFPRLGTFRAVSYVNSVLARAAEAVRSTGFNELMLPVAEDVRLKELTRVGELRVEDLVALSTLCVAGLDMAAVPRDGDYLRRLFEDTYAAYSVKRRPYGVRVVPTDREVVNLRRFGELPRFR